MEPDPERRSAAPADCPHDGPDRAGGAPTGSAQPGPPPTGPPPTGPPPTGRARTGAAPTGAWRTGTARTGTASARLTPAGLRDAWRRRSLATGWLAADDWRCEAVDAVVAACDAGWAPGLSVACGRLGRSRAEAGVGIAETIEDLAALFAVLGRGAAAPGAAGQQEATAEQGAARHHEATAEREATGENGAAGEHGGEPPLRLICSLAEGWAEEGMAQLSQGSCEDPLSGLATLPYLCTRLAEVYREAEHRGTSPADTHSLVAVGLPRRPDPWRQMALAIGVGRDLRAAFPGGETLSRAGARTIIALVPAHDDLPLRWARLRRDIPAAFGAEIRMPPLPARLAEALRLVRELAR